MALFGDLQQLSEITTVTVRRKYAPLPTDKEIVARWRGKQRMGRRRHGCKLSPTQRAKKRWHRKRQRRMIAALFHREFKRRSVLPALWKLLSDEPTTDPQFNWWEITPKTA